MKSGVRATVLGCLAFVAIVLGMFFYNMTRERGLNDEQLHELGAIVLPAPRAIAPFTLQQGDGRSFGNAQLEQHWSLLYFGYTNCPDACPTTLRDLAAAWPEIGKQLREHHVAAKLQMVFVSVDPERDTPARLKTYVSFFNREFIGATASHAVLAGLSTQLNVAFGKVPGNAPGTYVMDHSTNVVLINPHGHYQGFLRPPFTAARVAPALATVAAR